MKRDKPSGSRSSDLTTVHVNAAAIDIGATMHMAAVGADRSSEPVRSFGTFTADLCRLADGFAECGVKTVVMESTGVYWIPIFELLDERSFEVFLVNARDAKHAPGRKTDVSDAQWLQRLHSHGLLRASFRPKGEIAELRAYLRQREGLLDYAALHIQHMQKALTEMNLQLHHVVSDVTGATGLRIIRAIVAGERDPAVLAMLRDTRCHADAETIQKALGGHYRSARASIDCRPRTRAESALRRKSSTPSVQRSSATSARKPSRHPNQCFVWLGDCMRRGIALLWKRNLVNVAANWQAGDYLFGLLMG